MRNEKNRKTESWQTDSHCNPKWTKHLASQFTANVLSHQVHGTIFKKGCLPFIEKKDKIFKRNLNKLIGWLQIKKKFLNSK